MSERVGKRELQLRSTACCGAKPLIYMRPSPHQFCSRCDRAYDAATERQIENWAWRRDANGDFAATYPASEYVSKPGRSPTPPSQKDQAP